MIDDLIALSERYNKDLGETTRLYDEQMDTLLRLYPRGDLEYLQHRALHTIEHVYLKFERHVQHGK